MKNIEILLADPDDLRRSSLKEGLQTFGAYIKEFVSAEHLLIHLLRYPTTLLNGRLVLMNEEQTGMMGITAFAQLALLEPGLKVILVGENPTAESIIHAWNKGVASYFKFPVDANELWKKINEVTNKPLAGTDLKSPETIDQLKAKYKALTPRERQVLLLISKGCRNKEIALDLKIAVTTVKMHRKNLMDKLEMGSIAELVAFQHNCLHYLN